MANAIYQKKIIVPFTGLVGVLGCSGPIDVPFYLPVEKIGEIIAARYPVVEILKNGRKVKLDMSNYDKENGEKGNESMEVSFQRVNRKKKNDSMVNEIPDNASETSRLANILLASTKRPNPKYTEEKVVDKVPAEKVEVHKDKKKFQSEKFEKK